MTILAALALTGWLILALTGFSLAGTLEPGAPEDNSATPGQDNAVASLAARNQAAAIEIESLQSDVIKLRHQVSALMGERDALATQLAEAQEKITTLEEELEDAKDALPQPTGAKK